MDKIYPPYQEGKDIEFMVEPQELSFDIGNIEPYRASLTLYNFSKKKKLSETYYFHCNDSTQLSLLSDLVCIIIN